MENEQKETSQPAESKQTYGVDTYKSEKKETIEKKPIWCYLGIHKYGLDMYHEEKGSFVDHSIKVCRYCGKKKKGTRKMSWDYS